MSERPARMIVGISGASGAIYGKRILEVLRDLGVETHLVMSRAACITLAAEADFTKQDLEALATTTIPTRISARSAPPAPTRRSA